MKESTGSVASIYIIIFFVVIIFGFIISILNYYKSYKINNALTSSIEDYGGFNKISKDEIEKRLDNYGYKRVDITCRANNNETLVGIDKNNNTVLGVSSDDRGYRGYCVYLVDDKVNDRNQDYEYYSYRVVTYLALDYPIINDLLKIPVSTKTYTMYSCYGINCDQE